MNKKFRIFLCSLLSVLAIFALAFVACDGTSETSGSDSTSVSDSTGSESSSGSSETTPDYDLAHATWTWTENTDGTYSVTVTVKDNNGGADLTVTAENVTVTPAVTTAATCKSTGIMTYTATFTYDGNTYTGTKDVEIAIDPDNHAEDSVTHTAAVASTAETEGNIEYWYCKDCGKYFSDEKMTNEITLAETVVSKLYTVSVTASYDDWYEDNRGYATFTAPATGIYTFTLDTEDTSVYALIYGITDGYVSVSDGLSDTVIAAEGDTIYIYLYSASEATTFNFSATYVPFVSTAVVPTALTINGDTTATLDAIYDSYELEYEVTDATAGEYTFTLSGDDLSDITVYIYEYDATWQGYYTWLATLSSSSPTATIILDSGAKFSVEAYSDSSSEVSFTVNTVVDTEAETRTGYREDLPVSVTSSYGYTESFEVTTSDTLYFRVADYSASTVILTITSSDATYTVYGYAKADAETGYTALTANDDGTYSFSLSSNRDYEYIKIVPSVAGTITVKFANEEVETPEIEYTELSTGTTILDASKYYTFTAETAGTYVLEIGSTTSDILVSDVNYFEDSTAYSVNTADLFSSNPSAEFELEIGDVLYISCYSSSYDGSIISIELKTENALVFGANTIELTADEAGSGVEYTYTVEADGSYNFSVACSDGTTTNLDAYVVITSGETSIGTLGYSYYSVYAIYEAGYQLTAGTVVTFLCQSLTYENGTGAATTYVITISDVASGTELCTGDNSIGLTADESTDGVTYTYTAKTDGDYTFAVSDYTNIYMKVYATSTLWPDATFGLYLYSTTVSLSAGDVVSILYQGYESGTASSCTLTISWVEAVESDVPETLEEGDNTITLSSYDAYYYYNAYYTLGEGEYTFTVTGDDVYVSIYDDSYSIQGWLEDDGDTYSFKLSSETTIYFNFGTYSGSSGTYTLNMVVAEIVTDADGYYNISTIGTESVSDDYITWSTDASTSTSKGTYSGEGSLDENVSLAASLMLYTGTSEKTITLTVVADSAVTFYYAGKSDITISYGDNGSYTLTATDDTSYVEAITLNLTAGVTYTLSCAGSVSTNGRIYAIVVVPTSTSGDEGSVTVAGTNAEINITTLVTDGTVLQDDGEYTADVTLYTGTDGTKVVVTAGDGTTEKTDSSGTTSTVNSESVIVDDNSKKIGDYSFSYRLKLGGEGTVDYRSLEITTVSACTITVYMMSSSSSSDRTVGLYEATTDEDGVTSLTAVDDAQTVGGASIAAYTYTVEEAGTYYLASTSGGTNIYCVVITYTTDSSEAAE